MHKLNILRDQKGLALVAVLFILSVIAGMGVTVTKISQNQAQQTVSAVQYQDAYYASVSGLELSFQVAFDNALTTQAQIQANLPGTYTLPGGTQVVVAYNTATNATTSQSTVGDGVHTADFMNLASLTPGSGLVEQEITRQGGGTPPGPGPTCSATGLGYLANYSITTPLVQDSHNLLSGVPGQNLAPTTIDTAPATLPAFPTGVSYPNRTYDNHDTANLSGDQYFNSLTIEDSAQVSITGPATVYVKNDFRLKNSGKLTINGDVRFAVGNDPLNPSDAKIEDSSKIIISGNLLFQSLSKIVISNNARVNDGGNPAALLMTAGTKIELKDSVKVAGGLYALDKVKFEPDWHDVINFTGSLVAGNKVQVDSDWSSAINFTYNNTAGGNIMSATTAPLQICT